MRTGTDNSRGEGEPADLGRAERVLERSGKQAKEHEVREQVKGAGVDEQAGHQGEQSRQPPVTESEGNHTEGLVKVQHPVATTAESGEVERPQRNRSREEDQNETRHKGPGKDGIGRRGPAGSQQSHKGHRSKG